MSTIIERAIALTMTSSREADRSTANPIRVFFRAKEIPGVLYVQDRQSSPRPAYAGEISWTGRGGEAPLVHSHELNVVCLADVSPLEIAYTLVGELRVDAPIETLNVGPGRTPAAGLVPARERRVIVWHQATFTGPSTFKPEDVMFRIYGFWTVTLAT